jgi:hypothetical protein
MVLRHHQTSPVSTPLVALALVLTLLLIGGGAAGAGVKMCSTAAEQARTTTQSAERGTCCCCASTDKDPCSTGLEGSCGQIRKTSGDPLLPSVEALSIGLSSSSVPVTQPSFSEEATHRTVSARETGYLIAVKLLC